MSNIIVENKIGRIYTVPDANGTKLVKGINKVPERVVAAWQKNRVIHEKVRRGLLVIPKFKIDVAYIEDDFSPYKNKPALSIVSDLQVPVKLEGENLDQEFKDPAEEADIDELNALAEEEANSMASIDDAKDGEIVEVEGKTDTKTKLAKTPAKK